MAPGQQRLDSHSVRSALRPWRRKADSVAVAVLLFDLLLYVTSVWFALTSKSPVWQPLASTVAGLAIGRLFIVGHDACHGSYTSRRWLNSLIGRLSFLPSLTPFSTWDLGHNRTHHVYTNLKPIDYVWLPYSKTEYDALPRWRKALEHLYRTPLGVGLYYAVEIWWKRLFFPRSKYVAPKPIHLADSLLCLAFGLALIAVTSRQGPRALAWGLLWPFAIWNWLMGGAIFEQHTHPAVPWFDSEAAWRKADPQLRCTVHVIFPLGIRLVFNNIFEHTAHHLDVTIPLYRLHEAQTEIHRSQAALTRRWTPFLFQRSLRICKLYDFEKHLWLDFSGAPTSTVPHPAHPSAGG